MDRRLRDLVPPSILFIPLYAQIRTLGLSDSLPLAAPGSWLRPSTRSRRRGTSSSTRWCSSPTSSSALPVGLSSFITGDVHGWGYLMAGAVLATLPVIALYIYLQKSMVEGLTVGGLKG